MVVVIILFRKCCWAICGAEVDSPATIRLLCLHKMNGCGSCIDDGWFYYYYYYCEYNKEGVEWGRTWKHVRGDYGNNFRRLFEII